MKNSTTAVFLAIIVLIILGYNYDIYHSKTPVEYVISTVEKFDDSPKGVFRRAWRLVKNNYVDKSYNNQDWNKWKNRYETNIETYMDAQVAIETMIESLDDPYTRYLTRSNFEEQDMNIDSKLKGVGVHITKIEGKVIIIAVLENSPAIRYGLREKDEIVKVDGISTKGISLSKVAELIRGEEGTLVKLTLLRDNQLLDINVKRGEIKIKTVKQKMLDNNIAYIRISSFISCETSKEFKNALAKSRDSDSLIIDVRGNYGGLLTNAVEITNMFLNKGTIVSIVDRNGRKQNLNANPVDFITHKPTVILIDEASASASEIFSGALQDHDRAILVGEKTFGKGRVQMILRLPDESGINLTVAKYLTPSGRDIDHKGVEPDYSVESEPFAYVEEEGDECLSKAVELLVKQI